MLRVWPAFSKHPLLNSRQHNSEQQILEILIRTFVFQKYKTKVSKYVPIICKNPVFLHKKNRKLL